MGLWGKIKNILILPEEEDETLESFEENEEAEDIKSHSYEETQRVKRESTPKVFQGSKAKTVSYNPNQMQVILVKPDRFDDVTSIADHLNDKKSVVLNLEAANREVSRRIIDFLSGVAYANHGNMKKVANSTFIIVPTSVDVMGEVSLEDFEEGNMYF